MNTGIDTSIETALLTGAYGFLGKNIMPFLSGVYRLSTMGRDVRNDYVTNLEKEVPCFRTKFDVVIHAAGKAHLIPRTKDEADSFYEVNVKGTENLCKALEETGVPRSLIYISSVSVYGLEEGQDITEDFPLNGSSPYARSKIQAERFLTEWCNKHGVVLGILRPPLIAGKNPSGNLKKLVRLIKNRLYYKMPLDEGRKSVVLADDIARIIPLLSRKGGTYNFCDTYHPTVRELEDVIVRETGKTPWFRFSVPMMMFLAKAGSVLGNHAPFNTTTLEKLRRSLLISNGKAKKELMWKPLDVLQHWEVE